MSNINYSQCWEDANLLKNALQVKKDDVIVSITSGGDNSLALLLSKPKKLFFVDKNPAQNYLAELKIKAPKVLSHEHYLELLGVNDSQFRLKYFEQIANELSSDTSSWFRQHSTIIENGVIHSGKFERYLNRFRKFLLPLVHSKQTISRFVNQDNLQDQVTFYEGTWNTWRWQLFFDLASNTSLLKKFARQVGTVSGQLTKDTSYLKQLESLIYRSHLRDNHYIHYSLLGEYGDSCPEYLLQSSHTTFRDYDQDTYEFHSEDLLSFLKKTPDNSLTKFNLSDSFEFLIPGEALNVWREVIRTAKKGAVVVYWCNKIEHVPPHECEQNVIANSDLETELKEQDRLYFYRSVNIYTITK